MRRITLRLLSLVAAAAQWCEQRSSFTQIELSEAQLVRTNLGGLGGRCDTNPGLCTEAGQQLIL